MTVKLTKIINLKMKVNEKCTITNTLSDHIESEHVRACIVIKLQK